MQTAARNKSYFHFIRAKVLSAQDLSSSSQIAFLTQNSSLGDCFPKAFLKPLAEDTLVITKKWKCTVLFYMGYPQHQCSAEKRPPCLLLVWHSKLLSPVRLGLYSKWPDFSPWHILLVEQTWCHWHTRDTFLRAPGNFISLFRLS